MIEQIGSSIVMFLLGAALSYFSTRWSCALKKITILEDGLQALLRDHMLHLHRSYAKSGDAPTQGSPKNIQNTT